MVVFGAVDVEPGDVEIDELLPERSVVRVLDDGVEVVEEDRRTNVLTQDVRGLVEPWRSRRAHHVLEVVQERLLPAWPSQPSPAV